MNRLRFLPLVGAWLMAVTIAVECRCEVIGVYEGEKLRAERERLEKRTGELWKLMSEKLLSPGEQAALKNARLRHPTICSDGSLLNFYAVAEQQTVYLPIHSLLMLEDVCTAYAWLYYNGYSAITINEYASMLKYRRPTAFPGGEYPPPLKALQIPENALMDERVDALSLRFRNSAFAYVLAHEMGHVLHRHPGNRAVPPENSRAHERQADEFALRVIKRDKQIPMGAILFFQMTAFISSPGRFDYPSVEAWEQELRKATHPLTSDRVRGFAELMRREANDYGENRLIALDVAGKLEKIATEMDDRDWQDYFRRIGKTAPLSYLRPRKK